MAVIEILGTDSLSSSRITLNDNFVELQDRVDDISTYLDTTAATITGVALITATQLSVSGGSTLVNVTASDITLSGSADFQGTVFKTAVEGSMASGVTSFATTFSSHTYFVQDTGTPITLPAGQHGQEIMLIADTGGNVILDPSTISGINTAELPNTGDAVELRAIDSGNGNVWWYCVGKSGGAQFS
jgi:hypothetical protein